MALNINGKMKVKTLRADFKKEFGLALRVYDGRSFADDNATLASIRKGDSVGGEFSPQRNTKVGNLEDKIMDMFGIKTQVAGSDDSYLCENNYTLAKALEADEKLMLKREKRGDKATPTSAKDEESVTEDNSQDSSDTDDMSLEEIIKKIKIIYKDYENLNEMINDLENGSYFDHWADKLCKDELNHNVNLARQLCNIAIKVTEDSYNLSKVIKVIANKDAINDRSWAIKEINIVLENIGDAAGYVPFVAIIFKNLNDVDWAKKVLKTAIDKIQSENKAISFTGILEYELGDEDWAFKIIENRENKADDIVKNDVHAEVASEAGELSEEEKKWLDDLWSLDEAPEAVRSSRHFMLLAVKENGNVLEYAADELRDDKEVVLEAIKDDACAFEYASDALRDDRDIALQVVKADGDMLEYASDALRSDHEIVIEAVKNYDGALQYAAESVKGDKAFVLGIIQSFNEKIKELGNVSSRDVEAVESFDSTMFSDIEIVDEMLKYKPHAFISALIDDAFNELKEFNDKIAPAVKKEVSDDLKLVIEIIDGEDLFAEKINKTIGIMSKYDMNNLVYTIDYKLENPSSGDYEKSPLWKELRKRCVNEILTPLEEKASSFSDYKNLIQMVLPNSRYYLLIDDIDKEIIGEYYEALIDHITDDIPTDSLFGVYYDESGYFEIESELPDIAERLMEIIGKRVMSELDKDVFDAINDVLDNGSKLGSLPKNVKDALLQGVELLSEEQKEDIYDLDEFIENLG